MDAPELASHKTSVMQAIEITGIQTIIHLYYNNCDPVLQWHTHTHTITHILTNCWVVFINKATVKENNQLRNLQANKCIAYTS